MSKNDILKSWKENLFIVAPPILTDPGEPLIILTDLSYWNENFNALKKWCEENNCVQQGMTVVAPDQKAITAFCLKWS
jgi:hypothetical protein